MISKSEINFLEKSKIPIRVSGIKTNNWPFILSMWYIYENGLIFLATPEKAKVVKHLKMNPNCAFEVSGDLPPYCGIRGTAKADINYEIGVMILKKLLKKYIGNIDSPLSKKLLTRDIKEVSIILTPVKLYSWNFTKRMKRSINQNREKICPDLYIEQ